jgi:SAM-dependent methyltransferase
LLASEYFDEVCGIDINEEAVSSANKLMIKNGRKNLKFLNISNQTLQNLPPHDVVISIMVIELARSVDVIEIFETVGRILRPGGLFLCMTRTPTSYLKAIVLMERFRWQRFDIALKRTVALGRGALEAIFSTRVQPIERARFYHSSKEIIDLGQKKGLKLRHDPKDLAHRDEFIHIERMCTPPFLKLRMIDWYIFEKSL